MGMVGVARIHPIPLSRLAGGGADLVRVSETVRSRHCSRLGKFSIARWTTSALHRPALPYSVVDRCCCAPSIRSLRRPVLAHTVSFLHETATIVFVVSRRIRDVPSSSYLRTRSLAPWPGLHHTPPRTSMKGRDAVSSTWWSQTTALTPTSHTPLVYTATPSATPSSTTTR